MGMAGARTRGEGEQTLSPPPGHRQVGRRQTPLQILGELQDRHTVTETSLTSGGNPGVLIKGAIGCVAWEWK